MKIKKGDIVKIDLGPIPGIWGQGEVISAIDFGDDQKSDWYIELDVQVGTIPHGYDYWKQGIDGGTVEIVDPVADEVYFYLWDSETQEYWPIKERDGRLYGFPNSAVDGSLKESIAFLNGYYPKGENE